MQGSMKLVKLIITNCMVSQAHYPRDKTTLLHGHDLWVIQHSYLVALQLQYSADCNMLVCILQKGGGGDRDWKVVNVPGKVCICNPFAKKKWIRFAK